MRLSALRKLVEQVAAGGSKKFNYAESQTVADVAAQGVTNQDPIDPTVDNLVIVTFDVGTHGVHLEVESTGVGYADGVDQGLIVMTAEVPAGAQYTAGRNGVSSSVTNIVEVPRNA